MAPTNAPTGADENQKPGAVPQAMIQQAAAAAAGNAEDEPESPRQVQTRLMSRQTEQTNRKVTDESTPAMTSRPSTYSTTTRKSTTSPLPHTASTTARLKARRAVSARPPVLPTMGGSTSGLTSGRGSFPICWCLRCTHSWIWPRKSLNLHQPTSRPRLAANQTSRLLHP